LPSKDDYEDTPYLLAKAVNLLSVLESVSFQEIVDAIAFGASGSIGASSLAVECCQLREVERLIGRALAGNPPPDIADELRDLLLDAVYSQRQAI
jgi:hypothetical protein